MAGFQEYQSRRPIFPFEGDRIPNRPYLFANGSFQYDLPEVLGGNGDVRVFGNTRYVKEFFRTWESQGNPDFKQTIPDQWIQNMGVTYQFDWSNAANAITLEVQNLSNAKVFDFFGVQRPGRALFMKLLTRF